MIFSNRFYHNEKHYSYCSIRSKKTKYIYLRLVSCCWSEENSDSSHSIYLTQLLTDDPTLFEEEIDQSSCASRRHSKEWRLKELEMEIEDILT